MEIIERRIAYQDWYETEYTNTGWDNHGWFFEDCGDMVYSDWELEHVIDNDKYDHPTRATFIKETIL